MSTQHMKRGFTIIEVVLVLAIAALIFLMIFVALPALQASQRDTSRKQDASIVSAAVTKYTSSERKAINSSTSAADLQQYVDDLDQYEVSNVRIASVGANPNGDEILVYPRARCDGSQAVVANNARKSAVRIMLDNGKTFHCVDAS
ncbi:hypothetical protein CR983_00510 [Candidatus Saccharibacteria bacterium]|nr:MAG: hypothetical protein CR983_00510 [Candidatus Saccharibacteria bacterium]